MNEGGRWTYGQDVTGRQQPTSRREPEELRIGADASQLQHRSTEAFGILNLKPSIQEVSQ